MTTHLLVTGVLQREPETRTSRNGRAFVTATIRVKDGDASQFWRIFIFSEAAQAEIMRLREGDAIAVQGVPKIEMYRPEGAEPRASLSLVADAVLALRQPPKERKPKPDKAPPPRAPADRSRLDRHAGDGVDVFGDAIPF